MNAEERIVERSPRVRIVLLGGKKMTVGGRPAESRIPKRPQRPSSAGLQ